MLSCRNAERPGFLTSLSFALSCNRRDPSAAFIRLRRLHFGRDDSAERLKVYLINYPLSIVLCQLSIISPLPNSWALPS